MNFSIDIKKYIPKIIFVIAFSISLFSSKALGQNVTIEDVIQKDQKVYVYYTLEGNSVYDVNLYYVLVQGYDGWKKARVVSGDVGEKQKGGKKTKLIVWDVIADKGELVGKCDFKVTALDTKAQKKKVKQNRRGSRIKPKSQIGYITNFTAHPAGGLNYFNNSFSKTIGYYIDVRITDSFLHGGNFTGYYDGDENITEWGEILWTSVYNVGISLRIFNSRSKVAMIYGGIGQSRTKTYMAEYDEYNILSGDWWYYEDGGKLINSNINFGILLQTESQISLQIGIDAAVRELYNTPGVNIGVGFTIE